jgi:two-component system, OmpR family, phosphate regulon sensor histidine kinase PhoR
MPASKRLIWQLYPSYLLLVFIAVAGATWHASHSLKGFFLDRTAVDLKARAALFAPQLRPLLEPLDESGIKRICAAIEDKSTRVTVILPSGRVIGDSQEDPEAMENHADRPEFRQALSAGSGMAVRYSRTLDRNLMYVGVPIEIAGKPAAVLRTAIPIDGVDEAIVKIRRRIAAAGFLFVLAVGAVGFVVSRRITRPLEDIRKCAERLAEGDFEQRFSQEGCAEIRDLSNSMKKMALELRDRIDIITGQRNRIDAILSSMSEGVIAVDTEERVITLNRAAERMLDWRGADPLGRSIQEVARSTALHHYVDDILGGKGDSSGEIALAGGGRVVEAHGTELLDEAGVRIGALIVLNDVSDLRRLERVRRDFVANVSHELKTPVTAVKGFVEALLDGGIENREDALRFLGIIDRHVNRLGALIDDLLMLAKVEQGAGISRIDLSPRSLREVIETAMELCAARAAEKSITVEFICPEDLTLPMDPFLMEQAVANLVDNAIKYSGRNGSVRILASVQNGYATVSVADMGCGIPKEHLPRIFERFYRVDKARGRDQGGTGLGLAIVKHIVQAHGGRVTVESTPGGGSTFSMILPADVTR